MIRLNYKDVEPTKTPHKVSEAHATTI